MRKADTEDEEGFNKRGSHDDEWKDKETTNNATGK